MDGKQPNNTFDIRYLKLHFLLEFTEDTDVPQYKRSAMHGGLRNMLIWSNCIQEECIQDEDCDRCVFREDCEVTHIIHPRMSIPHKAVDDKASMGIVIEIEDYHNHFNAGDRMEFSLLLFGKTIVHANALIRAVEALGRRGLGSTKGHFRIVSVTNTKKEQVFDGKSIDRGKYETLTVADYIRYRRRQLASVAIGRIKFQTPTSIMYKKSIMSSFQIDAVLAAIGRRLSILDCFEGIEIDFNETEFVRSMQFPEMVEERHLERTEPKHSSNHGGGRETQYMKGIEGELVLKEIPEDALDYLIAGELIHVGKYTSYGFGRYHLI